MDSALYKDVIMQVTWDQLLILYPNLNLVIFLGALTLTGQAVPDFIT